MSKIIHASGKRKRAIARATLRPGKGRITINNRLLELYQPKLARDRIMEPFWLGGELGNFDIEVKVNGGGFMSQAEASRLAISRALVKHNSSLKNIFLNYDRHMLVADVRRKETCKPNDSKARKARQKSYR